MGRILKLLELILSSGRWDAAALACEVGCSERTVYRDLGALEIAGVPWYFDDQDHSYRVRGWYSFPSLDRLVDTFASSSQTNCSDPSSKSKQQATAPVRPRSDSDQLIDDARRLVAVLDHQLTDSGQCGTSLDLVQRALLNRRQLSGDYESPYRGASAVRTLHPYRLCLAGSIWYMIARPEGEKYPKTFRVARFDSLRMLRRKADVPEDFDINAYLGNAWIIYRGATSYDVEIEFLSSTVIAETTWHHTQQVVRHDDGRVTMRFTVDGLDEISLWVLGFAGWAIVRKPPELRSMVVKKLEQALKLNTTDVNTKSLKKGRQP